MWILLLSSLYCSVRSIVPCRMLYSFGFCSKGARRKYILKVYDTVRICSNLKSPIPVIVLGALKRSFFPFAGDVRARVVHIQLYYLSIGWRRRRGLPVVLLWARARKLNNARIGVIRRNGPCYILYRVHRLCIYTLSQEWLSRFNED